MIRSTFYGWIISAIFLVSCFLFLVQPLNAQQFNSADFTVLDPVINSLVGYGTSTSYRLYGSLGELAIGTSTITDFRVNAGFLFYPFVSLPVVTATAGDTQVTLSWTTATSALGWTVSGYSVGQTEVSGGPYSYTNVGNVLTSTRTGLANGTVYYFVIRVLDAFSNGIATSTQVSATPTGAAAAAPTPSTGGGGGPPDLISLLLPKVDRAKVIFRGLAFPSGLVRVLKDSTLLAEVFALSAGRFETGREVAPGTHVFSIIAFDSDDRASPSLSRTVTLKAGAETYISDLIFPPTLELDKISARQGTPVRATGFSRPKELIFIDVTGEEGFLAGSVLAGNFGRFLFEIETADLEFGSYRVTARTGFGRSLVKRFSVAEQTVFAPRKAECPEKGDLNDDCRVDLVDFSIIAFWFKKPFGRDFGRFELLELNGDGRVDLVDFSILAYHWTG